jgi:SAM-dependent methyltransferase
MSGGGPFERADEPRTLDTSVAHIARVQDYWLGGKDNFLADRKAGDEAVEAFPGLLASVRANRAFLGRSVRFLAREVGIRQFLDIGTGIPAANNTHEVAQSIAPECRIVYVDNDPAVLVHARALLTSAPEGATDYLDADLRETEKILAAAANTLDFSRPIAVMLVAILHLIPDEDDPRGIVAKLMAAVPPGSHLVISQPGNDLRAAESVEMARRLNRLMAQQVITRSHAEISTFFDGLEMLEPGLIREPEWRPDAGENTSAPSNMWAGIARKS